VAEEARAADEPAIRDSEEPSLPLDEPAIKATCVLFTPEDLEDDVSTGVTEIIQTCLRDVRLLMLGSSGPGNRACAHIFI
jgi:hypothetical protein